MEHYKEMVTTETTTETHLPSQEAARQKKLVHPAALTGLAVVGFIALIVIGITLAIYSVRYIPRAVHTLSIAPSTSSSTGLYVVPNSPYATSTIALTPPLPAGSHGSAGAPEYSSSGYSQTASAYPAAQDSAAPAPAAHAKPALYGYSDLSTAIVATGYLTNGTNESFVPAAVIPPGARAAVQFTVTNNGTNATGQWSFIAQLPNNSYTFTSPVEQNLNPGDHILFTIGFDQQPTYGPQVVTVLADPNNMVVESNEANNSASTAFSFGQ